MVKPMIRQWTGTVLTLLIMAYSGVTAAILVTNPASCPANTAASFIGVGLIDAKGDFVSVPVDSNFQGSSVYECNTVQMEPSIQDRRALFISVQNRQIRRVTNNAVNNEIYRELFNRDLQPDNSVAKENKTAASMDNDNSFLDSAWGMLTYSGLGDDDSSVGHFDNDIFQFVGGADKNIGDWMVGYALTYAYANTDTSLYQNGTSHTVGLTPYAAYQINDFLFASALVGYSYTHVNAAGATGRVHDYDVEANLNAYKVFHSLLLKARMGIRYTYSNDTLLVNDPGYDEVMGIGDAEIGYRFVNNLIAYTGLLYEYVNQEAIGLNGVVQRGALYFRAGVDYPVTTGLFVGAKIETDVANRQYDLLSGSVNFRIEL